MFRKTGAGRISRYERVAVHVVIGRADLVSNVGAQGCGRNIFKNLQVPRLQVLERFEPTFQQMTSIDVIPPSQALESTELVIVILVAILAPWHVYRIDTVLDNGIVIAWIRVSGV